MKVKIRRGHVVKVCTNNPNFVYIKEIWNRAVRKSKAGVEHVYYQSNLRKI